MGHGINIVYACTTPVSYGSLLSGTSTTASHIHCVVIVSLTRRKMHFGSNNGKFHQKEIKIKEKNAFFFVNFIKI